MFPLRRTAITEILALCSLYVPLYSVAAFNRYEQRCQVAPFNLAHPDPEVGKQSNVQTGA